MLMHSFVEMHCQHNLGSHFSIMFRFVRPWIAVLSYVQITLVKSSMVNITVHSLTIYQ